MAWAVARVGGILLGLLLLAGSAAWSLEKYWPLRLPLPSEPSPLVCEVGNQSSVRAPGRHFVAEIGRFEDELFAYLMLDYLRGARALDGLEVMLTYTRQDDRLAYLLWLLMPDDLLEGVPMLTRLESANWIPSFTWWLASERAVAGMRRQTQTFVTAYNFPAYRRLEHLTRAELVQYIRRFVRFKSTVDPRSRTQRAVYPGPLDLDQAQSLAEDIVTVADFFSLPLDLFLGIGAMENNYMNIRGDLNHAVWKQKAQPGDVVLRRRGGRVLVANEAIGVWQITRETLRYAHKLYLKDDRDYTLLPAHLRPPQKLDLNEIRPEVLTTYAGLFFRYLVDRLGGDIAKAVGAYNGGPGNPNMRYEAGVRDAAAHARRAMEQAAALNGPPVAERSFLSSLRSGAP